MFKITYTWGEQEWTETYTVKFKELATNPAGVDSPVVDWRWTETAGEFFPLSEISEISESAFDDCAGLFLITTEETSQELIDAAREQGHDHCHSGRIKGNDSQRKKAAPAEKSGCRFNGRIMSP